MTDVAIATINTSTPNSGTGDTIYSAFTKTNGNFSNLQLAVDNIQNAYANTTLGKFANITVTNRVVGSLNFYGTDNIYINGSAVATAAVSFPGGTVPNQSTFANAIASTSSSTGAVIITGGLGVGGNIYTGSTIYAGTGVYDYGSRVVSASSGTGNLTITGNSISLTPTGPGSTPVGSSTAIPVITTDIYGRVVYSSTAAVIAPAGTLTGTTLASGVTASGLTSVGTLTALTVSGNTIVNNTLYAQGVYDNSNRVVSTSSGAGNLTISGTGINLAAIGPGAVTTGSATAVPVITTDAYGRVVGITTASVSSTLNVAGTSGTGSVALINQSLSFAGSYGVTAAANNQTITISTPQDLRSTASPSFVGTTLSGTLIAATVNAATIGNSGATLTGTLSTASQTNITAVGTLSGLTVSAAIVPNANVSINLGSTTAWWNNIYGTAVHAQYADLAEKYLADQDYPVGTVVAVGGDAEITACSFGDLAIGAVSANPAYMMNSQLEGGTYIALKGRVPVYVIGSIRKGQRLIASNNGYAVAGVPASNNVFAVALESSDDTGVKLIEAIIL